MQIELSVLRSLLHTNSTLLSFIIKYLVYFSLSLSMNVCVCDESVSGGVSCSFSSVCVREREREKKNTTDAQFSVSRSRDHSKISYLPTVCSYKSWVLLTSLVFAGGHGTLGEIKKVSSSTLWSKRANNVSRKNKITLYILLEEQDIP